MASYPERPVALAGVACALINGLCYRISRSLSPEANALIAVTDPRYKKRTALR